jgi:hypothetical protein
MQVIDVPVNEIEAADRFKDQLQHEDMGGKPVDALRV